MKWFDRLFDHSPYAAIVCLYIGIFTLFGLPSMWALIGVLTGQWNAPAYFILGFPAIGFVIGTMSYLLNERWS